MSYIEANLVEDSDPIGRAIAYRASGPEVEYEVVWHSHDYADVWD